MNGTVSLRRKRFFSHRAARRSDLLDDDCVCIEYVHPPVIQPERKRSGPLQSPYSWIVKRDVWYIASAILMLSLFRRRMPAGHLEMENHDGPEAHRHTA